MEALYYLGIQIEFNRAEKKMLLHQSTYISNLLWKYGMQNFRAVPKPQATSSTVIAKKVILLISKNC